MQRITRKFLQAQIDTLNRMTGNPLEPYRRDENGKAVSNAGNYHLDGAYGGLALYRMVGESGGCSDIFSCGHVSARQLSDLISAYMAGIYSVQKETA